MKPNFFFHIHIPKTAGSTFNEVLRRNFGPQLACEYGLLNDYRYTAAQLETVLTGYPNLRAMASHRLSLDLPWNFERLDVMAISFIRDPGRRLLSFYFYNRHLEGSWLEPDSKDLPVDRFLQGRLEALERGEGNNQLRQLTGGIGSAGLETVERLMLSEQFLLFPSERFDEACLVLARRFPDVLSNLRYEPQKVSIRDQEVPADLVEEYSRRSEPDRRLHAMANANLDRLIERYFPEREELETVLKGFSTT